MICRKQVNDATVRDIWFTKCAACFDNFTKSTGENVRKWPAMSTFISDNAAVIYRHYCAFTMYPYIYYYVIIIQNQTEQSIVSFYFI